MREASQAPRGSRAPATETAKGCPGAQGWAAPDGRASAVTLSTDRARRGPWPQRQHLPGPSSLQCLLQHHWDPPPPPPRGAVAFQGSSCVPLSRTEPLVTHRWQGQGRGPWQSTQLFSATGLESCGPQLTLTPRQGLESGASPAKDRATSGSGSLRPEDLAGSSKR